MSNIRIPQFPNDGFIKISRPDDQYKIEVSDTPDNCPGERRSLENDIETKKREIAQLQIQIQEAINRAQAHEVELAAARVAAPAAVAAAVAAQGIAEGERDAANVQREAAVAAQGIAVAAQGLAAANLIEVVGERDALQAEILALNARIQAIEADNGAECGRLEDEIARLNSRIELILGEDGAECAQLEEDKAALEARIVEIQRNYDQDCEWLQEERDGLIIEIGQLRAAAGAVALNNNVDQVGRIDELNARIAQIEADYANDCTRMEGEITKYKRALFNISITKNSSHEPNVVVGDQGLPCPRLLNPFAQRCTKQYTINRIKAYAKNIISREPEQELENASFIEKKNQNEPLDDDEILTGEQKNQAVAYRIQIPGEANLPPI